MSSSFSPVFDFGSERVAAVQDVDSVGLCLDRGTHAIRIIRGRGMGVFDCPGCSEKLGCASVEVK